MPSRVTNEKHTRRRVVILGALDALFQLGLVEMYRTTAQRNQREVRFPAQAIIEGYFLVHLPGVGPIHADVLAALGHDPGGTRVI